MKKILLLFMIMLLSSFSVYGNYSVNLESYWSCDLHDSNSTHIFNVDSSNQNNDGRFINGSNVASGHLYEACNFDIANQEYIEIENSVSDYDGYSAMTVSFWIYLNSTPSANHYMSFPFYDGSTRSWGYMITSGGTKVCARISTNLEHDNDEACTGHIGINTWSHIVFTWDTTSDQIEIYSDAVSRQTIPQPGSTVRTNNAKTYLGASDYGGNPNYYNDAMMDEIGIWSRKLNPTEIEGLYNSGNGYNPFWTSFFNINYLSPIDNTISDESLIAKFSINEPGNCSIEINDVVNQTKSFSANVTSNFTVDFTQDGTYKFKINCSDGYGNVTETDTYHYIYDSILPVCNMNYLNQHLVGYFVLDETDVPYIEGVNNDSNHNLISSLSSAPERRSFNQGGYDYIQYFNHSNDDYVRSGNFTIPSNRTEFTINFWLKPDRFPDEFGDTSAGLFSVYHKQISNTHTGFYTRLRGIDPQAHKLYTEVWDGSGASPGVRDSVHSNTVLVSNKLYYMSMTFDKDVNWYMNATHDTGLYVLNNSETITYESGKMTYYLGAFNSPWSVNFGERYDGEIGGITYFDTVLNTTCLAYTMTHSAPYTSATNPPVVTLLAPENHKKSNNQESVRFNVTDHDNSSLNCDFYLDGKLNISGTYGAFLNNTYSLFFPTWTEGTNTWYVNCTDGETASTSDTYTFVLDLTEPFITSISPVYMNTTIYTGYSMSISGNVTDNSLFRGNMTIYYPNSTVFYNNYTGNLTVNTTEYSWLWDFNTTLEPNGLWEFHLDWADSHTSKYLKDALNVEKSNTDKKLRYLFSDADIGVQLIGGDVDEQFESITSTKHYDRYDFGLNFKNIINPNSRMVFRVTSDKPITVIDGSEYPCHAVTGNYWIDFAGMDAKYKVLPVNKTSYDCEIMTINSHEKIVFNSLGGLNENNEIIKFTVNNCVPSWSCNGYDSCNISDFAPCNSVIDANACGLPYTGDYSEFSQGCNYCSYNLNMLNRTWCVDSLREVCYEDINFGTCCNVTGIEADCAFGNSSEGCRNESCDSGYIGQYESGDVVKSSVDGIVFFIISLASMAGIIALIFTYNWAKKEVKK